MTAGTLVAIIAIVAGLLLLWWVEKLQSQLTKKTAECRDLDLRKGSLEDAVECLKRNLSEAESLVVHEKKIATEHREARAKAEQSARAAHVEADKRVTHLQLKLDKAHMELITEAARLQKQTERADEAHARLDLALSSIAKERVPVQKLKTTTSKRKGAKKA